MQSYIINGIRIFAPTTRDELMAYAFHKQQILVAVNAEKILSLSPEGKDIINKNLGYPDGIGAVWALNRKGGNALKIPGCELWLDLIEKYHKDKTFYLVGGKQEVIDQTRARLKNTYKGIKILNYRNGYIKTDEEKEVLINDIQSKKPDVVFVAMGSPKQELLMEAMKEKHAAVYQGLGGSFDVYTGNVKRAPKWWVKWNLEWAYRLLSQPKRIKRQIIYLPFMFRLLLNKL